MFQRKQMFRSLRFAVLPAALNLLLTAAPLAAQSPISDDGVSFDMLVSAGVKACLKNARARVNIRPAGQVEIMDVFVEGLPPNTEFDFFVIQLPKSPFGISWYQGDIQTDKYGRGHGHFVGRFSIETFTVAPGSGPAPVVFPGDDSVNPPFNPIQMYHLGLWFGSPQAAVAATCPGGTTPFNGDHNAGVQVFNTSNFPDDHGPLRDVKP